MEKQLLDSLLTLNLTHKEAQAYHKLATGGVMTAEDLSKKIKVQYPIVYRTLESLKTKGWIESTSERPKKYRAVHPKTAAETAGKQQIEKLKQAINTIDTILTPQFNDDTEITRQEIWTIRGLKNLLKKLREIGLKTKEINGKIIGPIDDTTFNTIIATLPQIPINLQVIGPPIVQIYPELEERIKITHPYFEKDTTINPIVHEITRSKEEFLKKAHKGSRFATIQLIFDQREAIIINLPYKNHQLIKEKVWANWIIDPEYISVIKTEE